MGVGSERASERTIARATRLTRDARRRPLGVMMRCDVLWRNERRDSHETRDVRHEPYAPRPGALVEGAFHYATSRHITRGVASHAPRPGALVEGARPEAILKYDARQCIWQWLVLVTEALRLPLDDTVVVCHCCPSGRGRPRARHAYTTVHYITLHYITLHYRARPTSRSTRRSRRATRSRSIRFGCVMLCHIASQDGPHGRARHALGLRSLASHYVSLRYSTVQS